MTVVETLRTAAERLRQYADRATRGPWVWAGTTENYADIYHRIPDMGTVGVAAHVGTSDAHYIAAMHPGVGLALAKTLALDADALEMALDQGEDVGTGYDDELAIARLILGVAS